MKKMFKYFIFSNSANFIKYIQNITKHQQHKVEREIENKKYFLFLKIKQLIEFFNLIIKNQKKRFSFHVEKERERRQIRDIYKNTIWI